MRSQAEIAQRLLEARATVRELERRGADRDGAALLDSVRLGAYRAFIQALAWALDIDLNQIDAPVPLLGDPELPSAVMLHRIELGERANERVMWLAEIPAHEDAVDAGYSTEYWSCFFNVEQAHELRDALVAALADVRPETAGLRLPPLQPRSLAGSRQLSRSQLQLPLAPAAPDTVGGYADYAGLSAFSRAEDDDDEPPALPAWSPRGA
jgi:hypothetical protein